MLRKFPVCVTWLIAVELSWHCGGLLRLAHLSNPQYWIMPVLLRKLWFYALTMIDYVYGFPLKTELTWSEQTPSSSSLLSWQWSFINNAAEVPCSEGNFCTLQHHPADLCVNQNISEPEVRLRLHGATNCQTNVAKDFCCSKHTPRRTSWLMVIVHLIFNLFI